MACVSSVAYAPKPLPTKPSESPKNLNWRQRTAATLVLTAEYKLNADRTHRQLGAVHRGSGNVEADVDSVGQKAREKIYKFLGRSLAIREVDAGSCNGCEVEIVALNNPIHDIERFGIQFVASPRHADMLLVTGPVTRNMEMALLKTYQAMPEPKVVVAVGACGISGGIFGKNYASLGGVDNVVPVDVYIPGMSAPAAGSPPRNPARCRAARREAVSRARWVIRLSGHPNPWTTQLS